jgi:DNA topoisomerase-3
MLEKQTMPKPLYSEATLLAAMERAGGNEQEDGQPHDTKAVAGIGTPATRAAIIETLFKRGYMEREKKNLIPTDKGLRLYHAVKSMQIADARLTVEWENKLAQIEKEPSFREVFSNEIKEFTKSIVDEISSLELPANSQKLNCPKCKTGTITIYAKVAKCSDMNCNLTIFKAVCGKNLTEKQIVELVKNGKTGMIRGFKSKQGQVFDASLRFDDFYKTTFEYALPSKNLKK